MAFAAGQSLIDEVSLMRLTFIVTIDPVKGLPLLNTLIHSLNLQTQKNFNVVLYNQLPINETEMFARLQIHPEFAYRCFSVERFLGNYPLWDIYALHRQLLDADLLGDYFMAVHMEEFFDVDYVENATGVLESAGLEILFGNLSRTALDGSHIDDLVARRTARDFDAELRKYGLKDARHWTFQSLPRSALGKLSIAKQNCRKFLDFGCRTQLVPSRSGYTKLSANHEDLYFMSKGFAKRYDWFLSGRSMYFEDIHLCEQPGVCELSREIAKLTDFPNYFNLSKIYHVNHSKFYYQLQDAEFSEALLALNTTDPVLQTLQKALRMYRAGIVTLEEALLYTRQNVEETGTQNLNYKYHMHAIEKSLT
jgi:hypothetical protein